MKSINSSLTSQIKQKGEFSGIIKSIKLNKCQNYKTENKSAFGPSLKNSSPLTIKNFFIKKLIHYDCSPNYKDKIYVYDDLEGIPDENEIYIKENLFKYSERTEEDDRIKSKNDELNLVSVNVSNLLSSRTVSLNDIKEKMGEGKDDSKTCVSRKCSKIEFQCENDSGEKSNDSNEIVSRFKLKDKEENIYSSRKTIDNSTENVTKEQQSSIGKNIKTNYISTSVKKSGSKQKNTKADSESEQREAKANKSYKKNSDLD